MARCGGIKFTSNGDAIRESTKQTNKRVAEQVEAARKTQLAKGEVGIQDRKQVPTLAEFSPRFEEYIETRCADKPATVSFYKRKVARLLASELKTPGSVNRKLATLRRMLRLAQVNSAHSADTLVLQRANGEQLSQTWLNEQHRAVRETLKLTPEFVPHSLRHTFGTRLGEAGADAFTIMRLMGHSSVTVSQRYVHPSPESVERAFARFEALNEAERGRVGTIMSVVRTVDGTNRALVI